MWTASLKRGKSPKECPVHDIKPSDIVVLIMIEFWGMRSTSLLARVRVCISTSSHKFLKIAVF